jgi:hypothetical protein
MPRGVGLRTGGTTVGRYALPVEGVAETAGRLGAPERAGPCAAERAQLGLEFVAVEGGGERGAGAAGGAQPIVPVRASYTRPGGPFRDSSRSTFSVRGTDHDRAAARPGMEVVPSDFRVAIAC